MIFNNNEYKITYEYFRERFETDNFLGFSKKLWEFWVKLCRSIVATIILRLFTTKYKNIITVLCVQHYFSKKNFHVQD